MQKTHAALHFAPSKSRRRTRGRRGSSGNSSGDEDEYWLAGGGSGDDGDSGSYGGNGGGSSGAGGSGRWWDRPWGSGDAEHWLSSIQRQWEQALYEVGWVWLALSMMSLLQAVNFVQSCLGPGSAPKAVEAS